MTVHMTQHVVYLVSNTMTHLRTAGAFARYTLSQKIPTSVYPAANFVRMEASPALRTWAAFASLCAAMFMIYLDSTIVNVALPAVQITLKSRMQDLQWLVDCYTLAFAVFLLSAGTIADRLGRKSVLLTGVLGFLAASVVCALADGLPMLLSARAVQGLFAALVVPACMASVSAVYPDAKRKAAAIGQIAAVIGMATAFGPVLGGWLLSKYLWQSIFWVNVPFALMTIVGLLLTIPSDGPTRQRAMDVPGQALMVAGLGLLMFALIEGHGLGWISATEFALLLGAVACGTIFYLWERRCNEPVWPTAVLRNGVVRLACAANFFGLLGFFVAQFVLAFWFQHVRGESALATGARFLWLTVSMVGTSMFVGRWIGRIGPRRPLMTGVLFCTIGLLMLSRIGYGISDTAVHGAMVILGAGIAAVAAASTAAILSAVPASSSGAAIGASGTMRQLGAAFGVAIAGTALSAGDARTGVAHQTAAMASGVSVSFAVAAALSLAMFIACIFWYRRDGGL